MSAKLAKVLTIPEVAAIAGWDRRRMLRHLQRMNTEVGGMLLRNVGTRERPRWTVTLDALKGCAPQWFQDPETIAARLEAVESETKRLGRLLTTVANTVAALTAA